VAAVHALPICDDPEADAQHRDLVRALQTQAPRAGAAHGISALVELTRDALPPAAGIAMLETLAHASGARGDPARALNYLCAALGHCANLVAGRQGRARPAHRDTARRLFRRAGAIAAAYDPSLATLARLHELYARELGEPPPAVDLLGAVDQARTTHAQDGFPAGKPREQLLAALTPLGAELQEQPGALALRLALALHALGAGEAAASVLDRHVARLSQATSRAERGAALYARGTMRARQPHTLAQARDDILAALPSLLDAMQRDGARAILDLLEAHLGPTRGAER
jgi:hypothetical protein